METDAHIHRRRGLIATIVTLAVLVLLGVFVVRVVYFTNLIRSGEFDASSFNFMSDYSTNIALAQMPVEDGTFDMTTTDDPNLGPSSARVIIVEFADFSCPYSQESSFVVRELAAKYPNDVQFIYRNFPLSDIHPLAQKAAEAGECAQDQGKFWEYHDKLYQNQASLSDDQFTLFAEEINMNMYQFETCLNSGRYADEVLEDYQAGVEAGVRGTPTFFINGNRVAGAIPKEIFEAVIESILNTKAE